MARTKRRSKRSEPHGTAEVVTLTRLAEAKALLRARDVTRQAGFTAERIPSWLFAHRPILIDDGPEHDEHRRQLGRFFAPAVLAKKHGAFIEETARSTAAKAQTDGACRVDTLALLYSVTVASKIVGLTHGSVERRAKRLTDFFRQPPVDHTRPDHGRTTKQWIQAAKNALGPLAAFYLADVRPAVRHRRKHPADDIISHLLERGHTSGEILMECLTYGTAGMVTTREFICLALWLLLEDEQLRARYLAADADARHAILYELIRLEPPVGHLYRRVVDPPAESDGPEDTSGPASAAVDPDAGCPYAAGTLVDIDVRRANLDPEPFGPEPEQLCPDRDLSTAERAGLSFGDGAHRCPGSSLAILETDALLLALLRAEPVIVTQPRVEWDTLIEGYKLRGFTIRFPSPERVS